MKWMAQDIIAGGDPATRQIMYLVATITAFCAVVVGFSFSCEFAKGPRPAQPAR